MERRVLEVFAPADLRNSGPTVILALPDPLPEGPPRAGRFAERSGVRLAAPDHLHPLPIFSKGRWLLI